MHDPDVLPSRKPLSLRRVKRAAVIAFWLALISAFIAWMTFPLRFLEVTVGPAFWLIEKARLSPGSFKYLLLPGVIVQWYLTWFLIVCGWLWMSNHMRVALVGYVMLCIGTAFALRSYEKRIDWTSRGLNPDRPGFEPQAIILAGTFDYAYEDALHGQGRSGKALFEIRVNGKNNYYCKRWHGQEWKVGSWYNIKLALTNFTGHWQLSRLGHTTRGGGGHHDGATDEVLLCRSLWSDARFRGVTNDRSQIDTWGHGEQIQEVKAIGRWHIPTRIRFTGGDKRVETYTVRRIEFANKPTPEWFQEIKCKHFDKANSCRGRDLDEPGIMRR